MIHGELGAVPSLLAEQSEMIEMHRLGPSHAVVQSMNAEKPHARYLNAVVASMLVVAARRSMAAPA
jgi:hypothetical protein